MYMCIYIYIYIYIYIGVAQWLRHCATSQSVTGIFLVDTDRTMCPGVISASKKWVPGIPLRVKAAGAWVWRPTTLVVPNVKKSGALTYPDPLGPSRRPVVGETFTFTLYMYIYIHACIYVYILITHLSSTYWQGRSINYIYTMTLHW